MKNLLERYPSLLSCKEAIAAACELLIDCYRRGGKLLLCGNGGSCADCEHISGELMKGFLEKRPLSEGQRASMKARCETLEEAVLCRLQCALPAIPLASMTALGTAFSNDVDPELAFAQSTLALGKEGDVLIAISTSGNAKNVCHAARVARGLNMGVLALTGEGGGELAGIADVAVRVPEREPYKAQELHMPIYHYLCAAVETAFFKELP